MDPGQAVGVPAQGVGGLLGLVDVLQHDGGAGQTDLALGAVGHLVLRTGLHDLVERVGEGDADGALLGLFHGRQLAVTHSVVP